MNRFSQRKEAMLSKLDKSSIGEWDKKIVSLCNKLNNSRDYYTTSSCSGRVVLMIDQEKKQDNLFLSVSHKELSFNWIRASLKKIVKTNNRLIKFKCEPPILHIACRTIENASSLLEKAKKIGWKKSGIISFRKNIILELHSTDKLEFPIMDKGKSLVDDSFLKLIVKQSNEKLRKGWKKIELLKKSL